MNKTLTESVRKKYSDNIEQFAFRLGANPKTVARWEDGKDTGTLGTTLLHYACAYYLDLKPAVPEAFASLSTAEKIITLMDHYGDNVQQFANRIGVSGNHITRWKQTGLISNMGLRLIYEVAIHPERFTRHEKQNTI